MQQLHASRVLADAGKSVGQHPLSRGEANDLVRGEVDFEGPQFLYRTPKPLCCPESVECQLQAVVAVVGRRSEFPIRNDDSLRNADGQIDLPHGSIAGSV